ncbi:MAG: argininosuccinate lyase [Planctomycetota bacterium]
MALMRARLHENPDEFFSSFNRSFAFDRRLLPYDLRASRAWAYALARIGILTKPEAVKIARELHRLERAVRVNPALLDARKECQDVHTFVLEHLARQLGETGAKLDAGRSRNDLVVTDLRLFVKDACTTTVAYLRDLMFRLLSLAEIHKEVVIPSYTHARRAQPVLLAHWALAYLEMFLRDAARFRQARRNADVLPLGSGTAAGSPFPVDREKIAEYLGFSRVSENSIDAVADRDFVLDYLSAAATTSIHLSRLAEDLIIYTSSEFAFAEISDDVSTGSSLLPHKKNPDSLELIRGKAGRVCGSLMGVLTVLKGLPTAYNEDLQEDKEGLFDAFDTVTGSLRLMSTVIAGLSWNEERCRAAADDEMMAAPEVANYLVRKGVAQREAHEITGRLVRTCLERGLTLATLPLSVYRTHSERFEKDIYEATTMMAALEASSLRGGTAPIVVNVALARAHKRVLACAEGEPREGLGPKID